MATQDKQACVQDCGCVFYGCTFKGCAILGFPPRQRQSENNVKVANSASAQKEPKTSNRYWQWE